MLGLGITIYLVQKQQIFRSRASQEVYSGFEIKQIKDGSEQPVHCAGGSCTTESLDIKMRVQDLQKLAN